MRRWENVYGCTAKDRYDQRANGRLDHGRGVHEYATEQIDRDGQTEGVVKMISNRMMHICCRRADIDGRLLV